MVYGPAHREMVLFGGTSNPDSATFDDTWTYDPAINEWTEIGAPGPSVRGWHSMAYDDASGKIDLFGGGLRREDYQADTWLLDPETRTWQDMTTAY